MTERLPAGYDAWRTIEPEDPEHAKVCPQHPDHKCDAECYHGPLECRCPTPEEMKAEAAEARMDAERER